MPHIVIAKCTYECWESHDGLKFYRGDEVHIDLANPYQRKLAWIKDPMGKWAMEFDRAGSSDPMIRLWFCKDCGQPFEKFNEMGTHIHSEHGNNEKREIADALQFEADQEEERIVAQLREREINAQMSRAQAAIAKLTKEKEALGFTEPEPVAGAVKVEEPIVTERRGRTFKCNVCGEVCPHPYALRKHKESHTAVVEPVTA